MGSLIHQITSLQSAGYGINVLEVNPPGGVQGRGTNTVAIVADLPWGPVDEVVTCGSRAEVFDAYCPLAFDALNDYPALKAFIGKDFPGLVKVLRISATDAAASAKSFEDATAAESVVVTARYPGALGDKIEVAWVENADDATVRDAVVTIGSGYSATYNAVARVEDGALVVDDPGDPFVIFEAKAGATAVPKEVAATPLAGGSDGSPVAADYLGTTNDALQRFGGMDVDWNVLFIAEPPDALIDDLNAGLKTFVDTHDRGIVVLCVPPMQSPSTAMTYVASYRSDRLRYPYPRVKMVNVFDPARKTVVVQGNAFVAAAIASVPPEKSDGGASGAPFLKGIVGLEQTGFSSATYKALNDAGIAPFFFSRAHDGYITHRGVMTSLVPGRTKLFRRRMTDYIVLSLADLFERYIEEPLDVDLPNQALGPVTDGEFGQVKAWLQQLLGEGRIRGYSVDPFGANLQSNIDAGQWRILLSVKLLSMQEEVVLMASVGETVAIDEAR